MHSKSPSNSSAGFTVLDSVHDTLSHFDSIAPSSDSSSHGLIMHPALKGSATSPATLRAHEIVTRRGNADRLGRNNVVVLAADKARLDELFGRVKQYLAWSKIHQDADASNLTPSNKRQAESRMKELDKGSDAQISAAYTFLLTPYQTQDATQGPPAILMDEERLAGEGELIERVIKKLVNSGKLTRNFGALLLKMKLQHLWANQPHLSVKQLLAYFAQYLYLDRLTSSEVLLASLREGVAASEPYFAYADGFVDGKYSNLKLGQDAAVRADDLAVVVSLAAAQAQRDAEAAEARRSLETHNPGDVPDGTDEGHDLRTDPIKPGPKPVLSPPLPRQVFAEGKLDDARMVRKFQTIYEEIIQQVIDAGGDVSVELVIRGDVRGGLNTTQQRNLSENARNLGLKLQLE